MPDNIIIRTEHVRKSYGKAVVINDISLEIMEGEIFGIVGPNGAGKTTFIECMEGLRKPDGGTIRVKGMDPVKDRYALSASIGIQLQESELQPRIKLGEAVDLYASFYSKRADQKVLLDQLGLTDQKNTMFSKLSGGQKQRLFAALALINDPDIVFLDELTTGLDPHARHGTWEMIRGIRNRGKTVFLTTHFMEEAEKLCDRVAIIDQGRLIALDTPGNLIKKLDAETRITFRVNENVQANALNALDGVNGITRVENKPDTVIVYGKGAELLTGLINRLSVNGIPFSDLAVMTPNLEDVFLTLTGKEMGEANGGRS
ncbi:MAG: ABC transporter ATP-binding protein [Candidatus Omnitrophota bacterium]